MARRAAVWLARIVYTAAFLAILGVVGAIAAIVYVSRDLPDVRALRDYRPPQTTRVLDRNGELVGEIFTERRTVVAMDRIPRVMVLSVLAAEDADFYQHEGLDYRGIARAVVRDLLAGRAAQGASTITQQVVKLMLLSPERTFSRKLRELVLARRLEQELTKDEILHLYLNHINFGHGRYGVQEAARYYFGIDSQELTLAQASLLAGVPQSPGRLSPREHPEAAKRRQTYVLDQLTSKRETYWPDLSIEAIDEARNTEIPLVAAPESRYEAPEIVALARRVMQWHVGARDFERGGYVVHTTVDLGLQRAAREALREGLEAYDARHRLRPPFGPPRRPSALPRIEGLEIGPVYEAEVKSANDEEGRLVLDIGGHAATLRLRYAARYNPDDLPPSEFAVAGARLHVTITDVGGDEDPAEALPAFGPQGAIVVLEPRSRDILALVGAYETTPGFDRATQGLRQPGSTFKPIVYAYGIDQRALTPATIVIDAPAVYDQWQPQNYETWRFAGNVRLRDALAKSINMVAVRTIEQLDPLRVVEFARALGISTELDPSLALALGSSGVHPIELVNAYATFAAGGRWESPRVVTRIVPPSGREIQAAAAEPPRDVLDPAEAFVVTSLLRSVVEPGGTGERAQRIGRPVAGKTGTSNEARDAWFVGYTPDRVAGVWIGFDDRRVLGRRESGGRTALPIFIEVMKKAVERLPAIDFPMPTGVVTARIDPASGLLAYEGQENAIDEYFVEGTAPTQVARPPDVAAPNQFLMEQLGGGDEAVEDGDDPTEPSP